MADRSVVVTLRAAVGQYMAGMEAAAASTRAAMGTMQGAVGPVRKNMMGFGEETKNAAKQSGLLSPAMMRNATAVGALGFGLKAAVDQWADFDVAMSAVRADTHETAGNMKELSDAALKAGADTKYSATDAAGAIDELAKAGVSTEDILSGGLTGALSLAAAGNVDVAESAELAATALVQFNLAGDQTEHVADLLSAGAGKAQGSVHDLGFALQQAGLVASQAGLSIEETIGTLSAFAAAGLKGSDAGTSFRSMLLHIANVSGESQKAMDAVGISFYDASGNMLDMAGIAGVLQKQLGHLTQEQRDATMAQIFGSDAVRAANVLYKNGAAGIEAWTNKVNDAGYAAETAAIKTDNWRGDLERLKGSISTFFISSGSDADSDIRRFTQGLEKAVDGLSALSEWFSRTNDSGKGLLATLASPTGLVGVLFDLSGGFDQVSKSRPWKNRESDWLKDKDAAKGLADSTDDLDESLSALAGQQGENASGAAIYADQTARAAANADYLAAGAEDLAGGLKASEEATKAAADALALLHDEMRDSPMLDEREAARALAEAWDEAEAAVKKNGKTLDEGTEKGRANARAMDSFAESILRNADAMLTSGASNWEVKKSLEGQRAALEGLARQFGMSKKEAKDYADQVLNIPEKVTTATELDQDGDGLADWMANLDGIPKEKVTATYVDTAQGILDTTLFLKQLGLIPEETDTDTNVHTSEAEKRVAALKRHLDGLKDKTITVTEYHRLLVSQDVLDNESDNPARRGKKHAVGHVVDYYAAGGITTPLTAQAVQRYAQGGLTEQHIAQLAPAGAMRVWAEAETGGEAYIPLADSKRARSMAILGEVADRFGVAIAPPVVNNVRQAEANRGMDRLVDAMHATGGRGGDLNVGGITVVAPDPRRAGEGVILELQTAAYRHGRVR